jgi:hypothetical protein
VGLVTPTSSRVLRIHSNFQSTIGEIPPPYVALEDISIGREMVKARVEVIVRLGLLPALSS